MAQQADEAMTGDASAAVLIKQLSEQTSTLVRQEIRLAQLELQDKGKRAGIGAGMLGAGGLLALYGLGAVIAAVILLLASAMTDWLAAIIVAVVLLAIAGGLALTGKKRLSQIGSPAPQLAVDSVKRDVEVVKESASR